MIRQPIAHQVVAAPIFVPVSPTVAVAFVWDAVGGATSYVLRVGTATNTYNIFDADVGNVLTSSLNLARGTYYCRVAPQGAGAPTDEQTVTV